MISPNMPTPSSQLPSRGFLYEPVKKMRSRCRAAVTYIAWASQ